MADSQSNDNNTCVVCFKNVVYYSIGECDHPVCFECSTRMRVLCLQNECPICRQALSRVVFTETVKPYKELRNTVFTDRLFERQFKIGFCNEEIRQAYEKLLENRCKLCEKLPPFRSFTALSDHMRKTHERYYCDLCVKHLKIFTSERRCYTRQELAHHRRKGDVDDTSHRGHPLCEFCEERFMDADELYRHLRKEHLYCHLCDADGKNLYYNTHAALAHHFRTDHYLCEEGECANNHLTAVFRTEIDLKAHKATVHGRGLTRGAARQARTLELQFNITPHPVAQRQPRFDRERSEERAEPPPPPGARIDTRSDEQFPRLSAAAPAPNLLLQGPNRAYNSVDGLARTDKNFPTLGGGPSRPPAPATRGPAPVAATIVRNSKPSVSIQLHSQPASASSFRLTQTSGHRAAPPVHPHSHRRAPLDDDDFPSLGGAPTPRDDHPSIGAASVQPPKVALINSQEMQAMKSAPSNPQPKRAPLSAEAFPALSGASAGAAPPPQWITVAKDKGKSKAPKTEPAPPPPREPAFNAVADFPNLPANKAKPKNNITAPPVRKHQPQPQPPPPPQPAPEPKSKKERKKQNSARKENSEPPPPVYVNGYDKFTSKQMKEAYTAAVSDAGPAVEIGAKIKTVDDGSSSAPAADKKRPGGNGDFALAAKDYPPLSAKSANSMPSSALARKTPNGTVPPGFSNKLRPPCDGMTFTNSAGQTFPAPVHSYIPPPDFEQRNRALVKKLAAALGGASAVEDFKVASRAFRDNIIGAEDFYSHCENAMGSQLESVFPELVALLPDIGKQQELVAGREGRGRLAVCAACGQLLAPDDLGPHDAQHWPPLAPH